VASTKDDKLQLAATGAQVVDMESYEVLSAAHKLGIPAIVVRVVSDSLDRKLPDFNRALNRVLSATLLNSAFLKC
jgi:nucleoside phosphorylase